MGYHANALFPTNISYGSRGGPRFSTSIITSDSGSEERTARWNDGRCIYDVKWGIRTWDDLSTLLTFFRTRRGAENGFPYFDWLDFATTPNGRTPTDGKSTVDVSATDVQIGVGDGVETEFQIVKKYTSSAVTRTRNITKPISGTVRVSFDDVEQMSGWTVDTESGLITFTSPPALGVVIKAGCKFYVPVRFSQDVDEGGLIASLDDFSSGSIDSIVLEEISNGLRIHDEYFFGDAEDLVFSSDVVLSAAYRVKRLQPAAGGLVAKFFPTTGLPGGGPWFYLYNPTAHTLALHDDSDALVATLPAASGGQDGFGMVCLGSVSGVQTWKVFVP